MFINKKIFYIVDNNKRWIALALAVFLFGTAISLLFSGESLIMNDFVSGQEDSLQELARLVFEGSPLRGVFIIFFNNLLASLQVMLLGVLLCIPPLLGLLANGALLGSVLGMLHQQGFNIVPFLILGILPHGIFELPAFFISAAFGLKIGFRLLFPLPPHGRKESLGMAWKEYWALFPLVVMLLILAAFIEVLLTPELINLSQTGE